MVRDDLGRVTREVRSDRTISLEQLALPTGICAPALSEIENEQRDPRIATLNRIAEALPVPLAF
ncbi:helix-turn-helix transcriptional regulator [Marivita sp.]|uniref:helix-turn-helix domain-containing protein n=1 Tax=Marivita sp. TaxID=2003365 RepID=UPI00345534E3